jgi:hypothetical protein
MVTSAPPTDTSFGATPRVFISYAWTNPIHQQWVVNLATSLRRDGVDVVLDVWDLKPGQDKFQFMEQIVADPSVSNVLMICNAVYAQKADGRQGGVGDETQIITPGVYAHTENQKFIPVLSELGPDGQGQLPAYLKSRIYVDLSSDQVYYDGYESLLRLIHKAPAQAKPALGRKPGFLGENATLGSRTSTLLRRAIHALTEEKRSAFALAKDHLDAIRDVFVDARINRDAAEPFDERVLEGIQQTKIYRDEVLELLHTLCNYAEPDKLERLLLHFFTELLSACHQQGEDSGRRDQYDPARFATMELFLYAVAILWQHEQLEALRTLLEETFVYREDGHRTEKQQFNAFWFYIESLERLRKQRLKLNRVSLTADLVKERADHKPVNFAQLQQADFLLYLRCCFLQLRGTTWYPKTLVYLGHYPQPFEAFLGLESKRRLARLGTVLDVNSAEHLRQRFDAAFPENQSRHLNLGGDWPIPLAPLLDFTVRT